MTSLLKPDRRIGGLDGLRALACLAVFGVHFHQKTGVEGQLGPFQLGRLLENGNTGVALFFMLSGFLLSLSWWRKTGPGVGALPGASASGGGFSVRVYVMRRIGRIVPAYYLCLTALVLYRRHFASGSELADTVLHYLFLNNVTEFSFYGLNEPFWTLAVQAQFYVLFPLLLLSAWPVRRSRALTGAWWLLVAVGVFALHTWVMGRAEVIAAWPPIKPYVAADGFVLSHSILAHLPHFLLGMVAAGVFASLRDGGGAGESRSGAGESHSRALLCDLLVLAAGLAVVAILATDLDDVLQMPHGRYNWPYVPVLIAVIIVATPFSAASRRVLDLWPLRGLGQISYGIYVYHLPCMNVVARFLPKGSDGKPAAGEHWALLAVATLALAIVAAALSYTFIEKPILRATKRVK